MCALAERQWGASSRSSSSPGKKTLHATERDTERVQQLRVQYWQEIGAVNLKDLVFVDETGCNLAMTRRYARSPRGSRAYDHAPYGRGQNLTLIGAMALRGLVGGNYFSRCHGCPRLQNLCNSSISA